MIRGINDEMNDAHGIDGQNDYNKSIVPFSKGVREWVRRRGVRCFDPKYLPEK